MQVKFALENPDKLEATMEITMTCEEWKNLRDSIDGMSYETHKLHNAITDVLAQARKVFYATEQNNT